MPNISRLFFGERGGNGINEADSGADDDGVAFDLVQETGELAPGGEAGEAMFYAFYVTLTYTMPVTVRIIPVLDGVAQTAEQKDIVLTTKSSRTTEIYEVGLSVPVNDAGGAEVGRCGMRGTRIQARIETTGGLGAGDLIVDEVVVEHEVVLETVEVEQ